MMIKFVKWAAVLVGLTMGSAGIAQQAETANFTFNVRVKVEGHVAKINTGIDVYCGVYYYEDQDNMVYRRTNNVNVLRVGETFVPQTADGYIEAQLTLSNMPIGLDVRQMFDSEDMTWTCTATPARGAPGRGAYMTNRDQLALHPAQAGTCPTVRGYVSLTGEVRAEKPTCAVR